MSHKVTGGISKYYGFLDFMVSHGYMIKNSDGSYEWSESNHRFLNVMKLRSKINRQEQR